MKSKQSGLSLWTWSADRHGRGGADVGFASPLLTKGSVGCVLNTTTCMQTRGVLWDSAHVIRNGAAAELWVCRLAYAYLLGSLVFDNRRYWFCVTGYIMVLLDAAIMHQLYQTLYSLSFAFFPKKS